MSTLFANNWITLWILTELINIIITSNLNSNKEITVKFYLFQTITSIILILFIIINNLIFLKLNSTLILIILWIKINLFPFHQWILSLNKSINWNQFIIINIINKIPPIIITLIAINLNLIYSAIVILTISIINLNQLNLKILLSLISISNIQWFMLISLSNTKIIIITLILYYSINTYLIIILKINKINFINHINSMPSSTKITITLTLFNLAGIPPLFIFIIKWFFIKHFLINKIWFTLLIFINIINRFILIKMILISTIKFNYKIIWFNKSAKWNSWWLIKNWPILNLI